MTQSDTDHEIEVGRDGEIPLDDLDRRLIEQIQAEQHPFWRHYREAADTIRGGRRAAPVMLRFNTKEEAAAFQALFEQDRRAQNEALARYDQELLARQEALAQMPQPKAPRGPRLTTIRDQAKKIGAPAFAKDGITYFLDDPGRQATDNDTDAEWAAFEARHGKA